MTLTVSRSDISADEITQYPVETRFIKLPIENYLRLVNITPIRPQIAMLNAINNPKYRFIVGALSRRTGKTTIANIVAHLVTLIPGSNVLIMSPNFNLSEISFKQQRKMLQTFKVEITKDNAKDRIIEIANGSTIRMGSVNQADACVGRSYDLILFDECALHEEGRDAFNVALRPTLDKRNDDGTPRSKAIFISTPRGRNNWFSEFYQRGFSSQNPQWCSIHSDYRENDRLDPADIEEARLSMSANEFAQEYEASFVSFEGQIFKFTEKNIIQSDDVISVNGLEFIAGMDVGYRDPTAIVVIGVDYFTGNYYVVEEYQANSQTTESYAEALQDLITKWNVQAIYVDSGAAQTRADLAYMYNIPTAPANKSVLDGIAFCQVIVEQDRLKVSEGCSNTIAMLDQYAWDQAKSGTLGKEKPKHNRYSHIADALRYALYSHSMASGSV